ncbi:alpha-N-methyltransferase NTM1, partial [Paraphysoderma sedebokerense]
YTKGAQYWETVEPTVNGMLGGFGNLDQLDARDSLAFIEEFVHGEKGADQKFVKAPIIKSDLACDCGAGIGRVTKSYLSKVFNKTDIVEQDAKFVETARNSFLVPISSKINGYFNLGLQEFTPPSGTYDLIWCQWVLGHLPDSDLIEFFKRCTQGLKQPEKIHDERGERFVCGMIGVKENVLGINSDKDFELDEEDSSVTRSERLWDEIFEKSGLVVVKQQMQRQWPQKLYRVLMWAL